MFTLVCIMVYYKQGNRHRKGAVATRMLNNLITLWVRQGDYFFPLSLSFISITIKEISDSANIELPNIKVIASNVVISTTSLHLKFGGTTPCFFRLPCP